MRVGGKAKIFKNNFLKSESDFFKIITAIPLSNTEYTLLQEKLSKYAEANALNIINILSSDDCCAVAKAVNFEGKELILKYYTDKDNFQQEVAGFYCLKNSKIAKLHEVSFEERIIEIEFHSGHCITELTDIERHLAHLAEMHVNGIENILSTIKETRKTTVHMFQSYYSFCFLNNILTKGEFIIGDHNPNNYLINDEEIIRIDLGTFQFQQPFLLDVYLFLYHLCNVNPYDKKADDILLCYYNNFVKYSFNKKSSVRKHLASNFERFKLQVNTLTKYIDKNINTFDEYYTFIKNNYGRNNESSA
jgi:hypothetical protein